MWYSFFTLEPETNNFIYGKHPVLELLKTHPKKVNKIFIREGMHKTDFKDIMELASLNRIPVSTANRKKLIDFIGEVNDQGVVAEASFVSYVELGDWIETVDLSKNPAVFLLDEITDPHNVGAILRTGAALGVAGVIIGKHNQSPINGTVWKTSAGMAGRVPIVRVSNINNAILKLKEVGFWICGMSMKGKSIWEQDLNMPVVFVVGNEGDGIRMQTLKHCDFKVSIPMTEGVESLNASVSTAIVGYEWKRQNNQ